MFLPCLSAYPLIGSGKQIIGSDPPVRYISSHSCYTRFSFSSLYVLFKFPRYIGYNAGARLRLSRYRRCFCTGNTGNMFTLAIFPRFQHSENIYAPALRSLLSMLVSIFHIATQSNEPVRRYDDRMIWRHE